MIKGAWISAISHCDCECITFFAGQSAVFSVRDRIMASHCWKRTGSTVFDISDSGIDSIFSWRWAEYLIDIALSDVVVILCSEQCCVIAALYIYLDIVYFHTNHVEEFFGNQAFWCELFGSVDIKLGISIPQGIS
jgi:hypothetical protein